MGILSFLDFSELPMDRQIAYSMLIPMIPIIFSETLFFTLIIVYEWNLVIAFSLSFSIMCFGLLGWYMWRDRIRREILSLNPLTAILRWSKDIVTWENQMMLHTIPLKAHRTLRPIEYNNGGKPLFEKPPTYLQTIKRWSQKAGRYIEKEVEIPFKAKQVEAGLNQILVANNEVVENILYGKYATEIILHHRSWSPFNIPYQRIQALHFFPQQDDFHECPDQLLIHQAQVLTGSSAVVDMTFLYWGERDEPIPVFLVTSSPELCNLIQEAMGAKMALKSRIDQDLLTEKILELILKAIKEKYSEAQALSELNEILDYMLDVDNSEIGEELRYDVEQAVKLGDSNQAVIYASLLEKRTTALEAKAEGEADAVDLAIDMWDTWETNRAEIRKMKGFNYKDPKFLALAFLGVTFLIAVVYWVFIA